MKKSLLIYAGLIAVAAAAWLSWHFHFGLPEAMVAKVKSGIATSAVSGSVTVEAESFMELKSDIRGRVIESFLELDKKVKAGDVLMRIDSTDLLLEIENTENECAAAKKSYAAGSDISLQLDGAKEALEHAERQRKAGQISDTDVIRQQRVVRSFEQRLAQEKIERDLKIANFENSLKAKRRTLEKMTIKAPFDGIITHIRALKDDLIDVGTPMARLIAVGRLIEARLSEENIAGVKIGQKAKVTFLPYGMFQYSAEVVKVRSSADPETQRYPVHLKVDIDPAKLLPGITGEVSIILDERQSKANVPRPAVFGEQIYVVTDGKVELRKVKKGFESMTAVEILEGLQPDELVIVTQLDTFSVGDRVKPVLIEDTRWR